ncbi:MAG: flagellin [Burkholderiales bacterium]|nr:flagellin [Burkholderiales bacterium]
MAAVLNSNIASLWASKNLQGAQTKMADSVERLSSGLRINRARDDAAGLGIANALTSQINGANQGVRNLNDGISMVQTAEGAIAAAQEMGQRILTLATQGANGTLGTSERTAIKNEMSQLLTAINAIGGRTKFSGNSLLNNDARTSAATAAPPTTTKFSLQSSNVTTDTIALSAAGFLNIGGFSSSAKRITITPTALTAAAATTLLLPNTTGLQVGMSVTGTGIAENTTITSITAGSSVVLSNAVASGGVAAIYNPLVFGGTTSTTVSTTMALATGSNPPQNLVGTSVYRVSSGTYTAIGTVTAVSGDNVTLGATTTGAVTWAQDDAIVFSGQLTQKLSGTSGDLSLAQSVGSTDNDTANFQMVQRAADAYVTALSTQRSLLGAYQNQIEFTVSNVNELSSNLSAARSNVQDTDYATETASLTKGQILQQAATAMLAQANQMPNVILSLLK